MQNAKNEQKGNIIPRKRFDIAFFKPRSPRSNQAAPDIAIYQLLIY